MSCNTVDTLDMGGCAWGLFGFGIRTVASPVLLVLTYGKLFRCHLNLEESDMMRAYQGRLGDHYTYIGFTIG